MLNTGPAPLAILLENDVFFAVKIVDTLNRDGYNVQVARSLQVFRDLLPGGAFRVALVNLAARGIDWQAGIAAARDAGIPVIAYGPHVDLDGQTAARAAGATRVIANSRIAELGAVVEAAVRRVTPRPAPLPEDDGSEGATQEDAGRSDEQP
ncbi:MAG TPA: hypothetical protein VF808_05035 [Ktedonobacterales bacterium]